MTLNKKLYRKAKKGQALAEYALIIGLIAVACIAALGTLGTAISDTFNGELAPAITGAF